MTPTSKSYLSQLKVPTDSNYVTCNDSDNELDDSDINLDHDLHQLELADFYDDRGDPKLRRWFSGIKRVLFAARFCSIAHLCVCTTEDGKITLSLISSSAGE